MKRRWTLFLLLVMLLTACGSLDSDKQPADTSLQTVSDNQTNSGATNEDTAQNNSSAKTKKSKRKTSSKNSDKLAVHFIDVGQGDSALITMGSHAMLIDAGDNSMGTTVQLYLQKQGITSLDYVIGTHPDSDHIGCIDVVIYKFDCKTILMPDCTNDTATYRDVVNSMKSKGYKAVHPKVGTKYSLGDASFVITGPVKKYKETNDNSISLRLTYQDTSFLFMGDTTEDTEPDVMSQTKNLRSDVLKIAHHGSKYSTTEEFFARVNPTWGVISCAEDNHYGFPSARVLNLLRSSGTKVFRTDEQGSLVATSDGSEINWNASPSTTWKAGENKQSSTNKSSAKRQTSTTNKSTTPAGKSPGQAEYVLNTSTKKFHKSTCRYISQISAKNKEYSTKTKKF